MRCVVSCLCERRANPKRYRSRDGWTNVTIWWGNQGDRPPYRPPFQTFDLRVKRVLQRALVRGARATVNQVALPYVSGVGGVSGGWAFM